MGFDNVSLSSGSVKKAAVIVLCGVAVVWVGASTVIYSVMRQPPERFGRAMAHIPGELPFLIFPFETLWMRARVGGLQIGDAAPDFKLTKLDKTAEVQLSSLTAQGKPVVLVFGSYT